MQTNGTLGAFQEVPPPPPPPMAGEIIQELTGQNGISIPDPRAQIWLVPLEMQLFSSGALVLLLLQQMAPGD